MAYSKLERQFWNDEKVRRLRRNTRDVLQYVLTSPHMDGPGGRLGCYVLDPMYAAADLSTPDYRWTPEMVVEELQALDEEHGRIRYDSTARLLLILRHWKHNHPENPNVAKSAADDLALLPFSETLFEGLLEACLKYVRQTSEKGHAWGSLISDAIRDRLDNEKGRKGINPSPNGSGNGSPNPMPNPEPEPEPEPDIQIPGSSEVIPDAPAEASAELPPQQPTPDVEQKLARLVLKAVDQPPEGVTPGRVRGELAMIVSGDDVTAWHDEKGDQVPWEDRPRLLRLALQEWYLSRDQYPKLRSALRYVVLQQYSPLQARPAMTSKDEQAHYQAHHDSSARRPKTDLKRVDDDTEAKLRKDQEDQARVDEWVNENPADAQRLLDSVNDDVVAEVGKGPATGTMVRLEFKRRVLSQLEAGVSS